MGFLKKQYSHEKKAQVFLTQQGLKFICRNYYCRSGELDLIMFDKKQLILVIVEVRYRQVSDYGSAEESVTPMKQKKIILATEHFLNAHPKYRNQTIRFDVMALYSDSVNWIQSAFE